MEMDMWISTALPYLGGAAFGAALTYGLTWLRERRRTLDAYRAPQRRAIAEIVAATHEYMSCELEQRTLMEDLIRHIRENRMIVTPEQSDAAMRAGVAGRRARFSEWPHNDCRRSLSSGHGYRICRLSAVAHRHRGR